MKLIIDIDEKIYRAVIEDNDMEIVGDNTIELGRAIANGIPYEERPQGKWKFIQGATTQGSLKCPFCNYRDYHKTNSNFCPNCGADMQKGGKDGTEDTDQ